MCLQGGGQKWTKICVHRVKLFPGLGKRGAGEQWTDERDETNHQKPRGGLPSTSGRKEVGKNHLADCKDISLVSHGLSAER